MKSYHDVTDGNSSSIAEQVGEQKSRVSDRLASVRHVVAVMSGKGGVGKSTVAVNLANALALDGQTVGLVDADINGPSIPKMTGVQGQTLRMGETGVIPAVSSQGIKVMSMDLFLSEEDTPVVWEAPTQKDAYTWRATMEAGAVREFFSDTEWGKLDVLLVDLPPGADKLPNLVDVLPGLSGAVIVTIPSGVSQAVVGKSITLMKELLSTSAIGLVENMTSYVCPHCGEEENLFPPGDMQRWTERRRLQFLGRIPFDPRLAAVSDEGDSFLQRCSSAPAAEAIHRIAKQVLSQLTADAVQRSPR